jgi:hypothetical protein
VKITIKLHNQDYIEAIRQQTGMATHTEALNHLLTVLKMKGFSLIEGEKYVPVTRDEEIVPAPRKEIVVEKKSAKSTMFTDYQIDDEYQIDPTIQRLINAGLEMEF